jgi:hypothetical protein
MRLKLLNRFTVTFPYSSRTGPEKPEDYVGLLNVQTPADLDLAATARSYRT